MIKYLFKKILLLLILGPVYGFSLGNAVIRNNLTPFDIKLIKSSCLYVKKNMTENNIPGVSVAVVDKNGLVWAEGFGVTYSGSKMKVNSRTLFSIQSQTKMFTTLGVMTAIQDGVLDLHAPISRYVPDIKVYSIFQKHPENIITLQNLLSHTAGFAHEAPIGNNSASNVDFQAHINSILNGSWLQFPVGEGYLYSNVGIDLAGYILQKSTKTQFSDYMKKNVLDKLGMVDSTYKLHKFLSNHNITRGGIDGMPNVPLNHSMLASGGMYSNAIDMSHYLIFQINHGLYNGKTMLNKNILLNMLNVVSRDSTQSSGSGLGIWKGVRNHAIYYSHLGRGFGFASDLEWYPKYHIGIVVLTNKYNMKNIDIKISHYIMDHVIKHRRNAELKRILHTMLGGYISNSGSIHVNLEHNSVILRGMINYGPTGNNIKKSKITLTYIGGNTFVAKNSKRKFEFYEKGITGLPMIKRVYDGYTWFINKPFYSIKHKANPNWHRYTGVYYLHGYGSPMKSVVSINDGYLYFNDIRMHQKKSNIFMAPNGAILLFNDDHLIWSNLELTKSKRKDSNER